MGPHDYHRGIGTLNEDIESEYLQDSDTDHRTNLNVLDSGNEDYPFTTGKRKWKYFWWFAYEKMQYSEVSLISFKHYCDDN